MTSYSQNDYYYNNENDALSYNSRPISSTSYIKSSSYGETDLMLLKRGSYHKNPDTLHSMYENYGSDEASATSGAIYGGGGGLRGGGHYYPSTTSNDNDIYHQQHQDYGPDGYDRRRYYEDSCDNMSDYGGGCGSDNRMSGRHSSMSTTAKQLPQIPMKHSSSMVDGISYSRGASLPTTPPVAHKKSRMLPQPTANGGIGGSSDKCLPATPRALPQVHQNNRQTPSARSGTGRKLLPTPNKQASERIGRMELPSTIWYDDATINQSYNNVRPHSSIPPISYNDDYSNYGYNSPSSLHNNDMSIKQPLTVGNTEMSASLVTDSSAATTRDLYDLTTSTTITTTNDDTFNDARSHAPESLSSSSTLTSSSCSSSGNGCSGVGRKLPKRLPTPNTRPAANGSAGKQLPKLPPIKNKFVSTVSTTAKDSINLLSSDYSKSYLPYSYTSSSSPVISTYSSSVINSSSIIDIKSNNYSSNLYPPSKSVSASSTEPLITSGFHNSYLQTAPVLPSVSSSRSSATYSMAVTSSSIYDSDDNNKSPNSYLNSEYHSIKSYPTEITTTSITATVTTLTSATTTTTTTMSPNKSISSSFSVTDYLKKFDIKTTLASSSVSSTQSTATSSTKYSSESCTICGSSTKCICYSSNIVTTTAAMMTPLHNGHISTTLPNGTETYLPKGSITNPPITTTTVTTTNYSSYISDYLKMYSSSDYNYDSGSTLVETTGRSSITTTSITSAVTTLTTSSSYLTSYIGSDYYSSSLVTTASSTPTCEQNGYDEYSKPYDTIDYFSLAATTTDYSEYLTLSTKSTLVNTAVINEEELSSFKYFGIETTTPTTGSVKNGAIKSSANNYDDLYSFSPTPTVTTIASNDDPYSYLDAYKVDLPVYSTEYGSSTESYVLDTYTEPNYSTTTVKTRLDTSSNDYYDDYRSATATPLVDGITSSDYKAYLYETNSNSGSGSGSGSGSSSNEISGHVLGKYDLTTSSSTSSSSGSTVLTTRNTSIGGGYYQPASSKSAPSLNTTTQKAASAAASKASSMFGSLSQGLKGGLDGMLSGVAAVADTTKIQSQQQQQAQHQSSTSIKSSAKSFGFGLASKFIPNLSGSSSQQTKPVQTMVLTSVTPQQPTMTTAVEPLMSSSYDISYSANNTSYQNDNQAYTTSMNECEYSDMDQFLTTNNDMSTCVDWNGVEGHIQSIYTTDSLTSVAEYNQGVYATAKTVSGGGMTSIDGYDSILMQQSSFEKSQPNVTTCSIMNGSGGKIVDYSDDYKYGYDEYSYSENDYIATGDITDNQNYNNNYDYMDDDATIVSQLLDNAAAKMAAESATTTAVIQQQITTTAMTSSFDAISQMDVNDMSMKSSNQLTAPMTKAQQQQQQQQKAPMTKSNVSTAQSKLGPTSLLSSLTSVATGVQQPQGQQQQPASKTSGSGGGGGLFGSFLGKAAAAVQSASQVVSTATAMTTAAVKVVPGTPFVSDQKNAAQNRLDTELNNGVVSGAGGAAVVTTSSSMDDYENSNLYEDDYYATSTTTTNTATNANSNLMQKMLPTLPLSSGKKLPTINGKSALLMKQQPTEIYDEDEEEYIDELDPNYRMDSEQDDYYMDQTAPSTTASIMEVNGYYNPPDGGYDYREDYFNEEDEYKYLEKEQQLKELRKQQQLLKHQKQPPLEYIEESHDDYIDDNYPSEDSANYMDDTIGKEVPIQVPVITTSSSALIQQSQPPTTAALTVATTPTSGGIMHHQIKKQESIIEEDEDEGLLTPDDSLKLKQDNQLQQQQSLHEESQITKKKTLTRGETEEVTSGQLVRKQEITARQRWNWAYNKIIMQLNVSTKFLSLNMLKLFVASRQK